MFSPNTGKHGAGTEKTPYFDTFQAVDSHLLNTLRMGVVLNWDACLWFWDYYFRRDFIDECIHLNCLTMGTIVLDCNWDWERIIHLYLAIVWKWMLNSCHHKQLLSILLVNFLFLNLKSNYETSKLKDHS